jgi:hypothetical protein
MPLRSLVSATGYERHRKTISVDEIRQALAERPELADEWIDYSADRRVTQGWYYRPVSTGEFEVGYAGVATEGREHVFGDKLQACAEFVIRELDDILRLSSKG